MFHVWSTSSSHRLQFLFVCSRLKRPSSYPSHFNTLLSLSLLSVEMRSSNFDCSLCKRPFPDHHIPLRKFLQPLGIFPFSHRAWLPPGMSLEVMLMVIVHLLYTCVRLTATQLSKPNMSSLKLFCRCDDSYLHPNTSYKWWRFISQSSGSDVS